jgi:hypothetical protein
MKLIAVHYLVAFAGIWSLGNGILHDVFVLLRRKPFDRDLIRLLVDGHILIFAGVIDLLCYSSVKDNESFGFIVAITTAVFLLGYCLLIFKMLPSWGMITINLITLIFLLTNLP